MKMKIRLFRILILLGLVSSLPSCGPTSNTADVASNDRAFAVAVQSDGRIVAAGDSYTTHWSFALMRYHSNGSLDAGFGTGGKALINVSGGARAVAIQSDGKIVAAGYNYDTSEFVLIRCNSNGSLDTGFGAGGVVQTTVNQTGGGGALAIAIQADGKVVAAGYSHGGISYDFALVRYNSNGTPDATFGSNGIVITTTGSEASGVAIQADGKIIAAGGTYLVRYNTYGILDASFGTAGKVFTSSYEKTSAVAVQTDGRIVTAGSSYNGIGSYDLALSRYNSEGTPDTSFAGSGRTVITAASLYPLAPATVAIDQGSGKITSAGYSQFQSVFARCNSNGTADATFASGGKMITTGYDYWGGASSSIHAIAVQSDGKIVVAGETYKSDASGFDFALARNNSDGGIDATFGSGGTVTTGM